MKRVRIHLVFHYEGDTPYEIDITRQNPNVKQLADIHKWVDKILTEEEERLVSV